MKFLILIQEEGLFSVWDRGICFTHVWPIIETAVCNRNQNIGVARHFFGRRLTRLHATLIFYLILFWFTQVHALHMGMSANLKCPLHDQSCTHHYTYIYWYILVSSRLLFPDFHSSALQSERAWQDNGKLINGMYFLYTPRTSIQGDKKFLRGPDRLMQLHK
jgi:hypothetical protein